MLLPSKPPRQSVTQRPTPSNARANTHAGSRGHNHGGPIKRQQTFTREPKNILSNLNEDYLEELVTSKNLNANVS